MNAFYSTVKLLFFFACLTLAVLLVAQYEFWGVRLLGFVIIGYLYAYGLELVHQCIHENMFTFKVINKVIGIIMGIPMFVSFTQYKYQHLHHHKYLGTDKDKEIFDYEERSLRSFLPLMARVWNIDRIPQFLRSYAGFFKGSYPEVIQERNQKRQIFFEYSLILFLWFSVLSFSVWSNNFLPILLWVIPWLVFGEPIHFLIEIPEHIFCDKQNRDVMRNTRSIQTNFLISFLVNYNNYHVEHHMKPNLPFHKLKELNHILRSEGLHTERSYVSFFSALIKQVFHVK